MPFLKEGQYCTKMANKSNEGEEVIAKCWRVLIFSVKNTALNQITWIKSATDNYFQTTPHLPPSQILTRWKKEPGILRFTDMKFCHLPHILQCTQTISYGPWCHPLTCFPIFEPKAWKGSVRMGAEVAFVCFLFAMLSWTIPLSLHPEKWAVQIFFEILSLEAVDLFSCFEIQLFQSA